MRGTLLNKSNIGYFDKALPTELVKSDILIGVIDEETDTACGVLAADLDDDQVIDIKYLFVAQDFRFRGAGTELVLTLIEAAEVLDATSITCTHSRGNLSNGIPELLDNCGFYTDDEESLMIYGVRLSELIIDDVKFQTSEIKIKPIGSIDDRKWVEYKVMWEHDGGNESGRNGFSYDRKSYDQNLSFIAIDQEGRIKGLLLGAKTQMGYEVLNLSAIGKDAPYIMYAILANARDAAKEQLKDSTMIIFSSVSHSILQIIDHVSGGAYITLGKTQFFVYQV